MPEVPTIILRCDPEFKKRFMIAARDRGTTAQAVMKTLAEAWLADANTLVSGARVLGAPPASGRINGLLASVIESKDTATLKVLERFLEVSILSRRMPEADIAPTLDLAKTKVHSVK